MKKLRPQFPARAGKVACAVSAAALMLGASHAATVGFNFRATYCGAPSYNGAVVTAPAFGIGVSAWENLTEMMTGYSGPPCDQPTYTLGEIVNTTTSTDGLNPLPNGSLSLNWSAATANVSGFNGYGIPFGGNGYHPGEQEVYWGFLRDGLNFGPGSTGGDNNQIQYSVDIVGLKTLFTNTPFVIQLIASGDSLNTLTNAFIIDATLNSTQSVIYPSVGHTGGSQGGAAWNRYIGGGISTVSGSLNTDHVKIIGNRGAHGGDKTVPDDYNAGSSIAGFIVTDKPVVTMSPQPVIASPHDNVHLRAIAAGVPPLAYQWRKGGVNIPGANTTSYDIPNIASGANYDLVVTNLYGSATSKVSQVSLDKLAITYDGTNAIITWKYRDPSGALLGSSSPTNALTSWTPLAADGASPFSVPVTALPQYFIYRHTGPNEIISNPFDQ